MKKKYLLFINFCLLLNSLSFASCSNKNDNSSFNKYDYITWSSEWSYNDTYHYHDAIRLPYPDYYSNDLDDGFDVLPKDLSPHEYNDYSIINKATDDCEGTRQRKCTVCGYVQTETYNINNVKEAIKKEDDYELYVKGIVGPSLSGEFGFYIIDENGSIACLVSNKEEMNKIKIGDEVVLKGKRKTYTDSTNSSIAGQVVIENVTIEDNRHGNHEYSTNSFIDDKSLKDVSSFFMHIDHTTEIYTLKATIGYEESGNYAYYDIIQGEYRVHLYSDGNKDEYSFLYPYRNAEVEMEIAICNFELKNYYKAICLSITVDNNKIYNTYNFAK